MPVSPNVELAGIYAVFLPIAIDRKRARRAKLRDRAAPARRVAFRR
jgi:hypothetical protein